MNKTIVFLLILLLPILNFAQTKTYSGIIKDVSTLQPIDLVSVSADDSNLGTVSNEDGLFRITLPENLKTLKFSHLAYNLYSYSIDKNKDMLEIYLEPKSFVLDEIVISNVPLNDVLADVIKNSKKHLDNSILLHTYNRELNNINGKYTTFADGILDYYVKKSNGKADVQVMQSRA